MNIKRRKDFNIIRHDKYNIFENKTKIGEIDFRFRNHMIILIRIYINEEYRHQGYGYKTIEYLLNHYKVKCIIGQTTYESRGFWNKCIKKYNGIRKNVTCYDNCSSSFIIPRQNINNMTMYNLLEISYEHN